MLVGLLTACALVLGAPGVRTVANPGPAARTARFPGERLPAARPTVHLLGLVGAVTGAGVSQRFSAARARVVR